MEWDGTIARMLKSTSPFGAQLDSLTDIVSFGVAPAIVSYMWILEDVKRLGWAAVLFYIVCCALRLARFNVMATDTETRQDKRRFRRFFLGVPSPAAAIIILVPLMLSFHNIHLFANNHLLMAALLVLVGGLMASRLPTYRRQEHPHQPADGPANHANHRHPVRTADH